MTRIICRNIFLALLAVLSFSLTGCNSGFSNLNTGSSNSLNSNSTSPTPTPLVDQEFNPPWNGLYSPDGIWRINGPWVGTGGNTLEPSLAGISADLGSLTGGFLSLTVNAGVLEGSEIQTITGNSGGNGYSYGYYEVRMQVSSVGNNATNQGVCDSFFYKQLNYAAGEIDFEFLTDESWLTTDVGIVHTTVHGIDNRSISVPVNLPFNPSKAQHVYGFLWTPGEVQFFADGQLIQTLSLSSMTDGGVGGYIMMNAWTGNVNWGGNPPAQNATAYYDYVKFYPGLTSPPN